MGDIIEFKERKRIDRQTISEEADDLVDFIEQDINDLHDMVISYPGLMAKRSDKLDEAVAKLWGIMSAIHTYKGD